MSSCTDASSLAHVTVSASRWRQAGVWLALLLVPALLCVPTGGMLAAVGPYWHGDNLDPAYAYLFNAVLIAKGRSPAHIDHPGTPVQVIGATAVRLRYAVEGGRNLNEAVVTNPEGYLRWFHRFLMAAVLGSAVLLGWAAYRLTGSLIVAGTCQGLAFTSVCVWHNVVRVSPEPLLLALGMGLGGLVLCHLRAACPTGRAWVLSFAAVVGVGVAVKLTFLPLAVIPWLMLPGWKYKVRYVAAASGCFVLATAPIWSQYRRFVQWMVGLLSHRGRYGSGEAGFDLAEYLGQLRALAWSEFPLLAVALAALAYVALRPILRRHAPEESAPVGRCLLALAVAMTGQFLMVAKHSSPRYLLPAFGLTGAVLALLLFDLLRTKDWAARLGRGVVLAGVGVLGWHGVQSFQAATHDKVATGQAFSGKLRDFFDAQPQRGVVVTYYGASSRAYALAFGNAWANNVCAASAAALHPPAYFYSVQGSGYSDLAGSALKPEAVMRLPGPVYFHGRPFSRADGRDRPADFQFESLLTNGRETLYRGLRPTTLPQ